MSGRGEADVLHAIQLIHTRTARPFSCYVWRAPQQPQDSASLNTPSARPPVVRRLAPGPTPERPIPRRTLQNRAPDEQRALKAVLVREAEVRVRMVGGERRWCGGGVRGGGRVTLQERGEWRWGAMRERLGRGDYEAAGGERRREHGRGRVSGARGGGRGRGEFGALHRWTNSSGSRPPAILHPHPITRTRATSTQHRHASSHLLAADPEPPPPGHGRRTPSAVGPLLIALLPSSPLSSPPPTTSSPPRTAFSTPGRGGRRSSAAEVRPPTAPSDRSWAGSRADSAPKKEEEREAETDSACGRGGEVHLRSEWGWGAIGQGGVSGETLAETLVRVIFALTAVDAGGAGLRVRASPPDPSSAPATSYSPSSYPYPASGAQSASAPITPAKPSRYREKRRVEMGMESTKGGDVSASVYGAYLFAWSRVDDPVSVGSRDDVVWDGVGWCGTGAGCRGMGGARKTRHCEKYLGVEQRRTSDPEKYKDENQVEIGALTICRKQYMIQTDIIRHPVGSAEAWKIYGPKALRREMSWVGSPPGSQIIST
ncbi:hypothetical protein C8R45DRAFT_1069618 [Mycena sanguinolenta]|nr:hypothetical protein C8R45DRAFT_1069618 [Mycena sanguinolenta]